MEMTNVVPLNRGSTKNAPPVADPGNADGEDQDANIVPQTLTRPGLIVVEPRNAPTSAEADSRARHSPDDPELGGQHAAGESRDHPGGDKHADDVALTGMPLSAAAFSLAPIA